MAWEDDIIKECHPAEVKGGGGETAGGMLQGTGCRVIPQAGQVLHRLWREGLRRNPSGGSEDKDHNPRWQESQSREDSIKGPWVHSCQSHEWGWAETAPLFFFFSYLFPFLSFSLSPRAGRRAKSDAHKIEQAGAVLRMAVQWRGPNTLPGTILHPEGI